LFKSPSIHGNINFVWNKKITLKKFPCMHGNINFVWNKIKDMEKFPHVFHKQHYLHGIFPSIDRKNTGEY
jgi:hypothetical protein